MTPAQKALQFRDQYNGKHIDEDGYYGAQCWDVVARYAREKYGCPSFPTVTGGAAGLFTNTHPVISQYFDRVANNPNDANQIPPDGAIIVWGTAWSPPYGHTAIKLAGGKGQNMTVFEQNGNNPGGNAYQSSRNYTGVIGWLVPKNKGDDMVPDQDNYYQRFGIDLALRVRGRALSRAEFSKYLAGQSVLKVVEILSDDPEAQTVQNWQNVGQVAVRDKWDQQIYAQRDRAIAAEKALTAANQTIIDLNAQLQNMGTRPSAEEFTAIKKQLEEANATIIKSQKEIEDAHVAVQALEQEKAAAEKTGNLFTRWIGDLINKIAGVK